jgi:CubicO group peptidase (beta-lactamase class C family)
MEQRRALVEGVLKNPPAAPPGTRFIYSNAGVSIAGAMAEKVTGIPWEELMQKRLFEPLGMASAGFGAPGKRGSLDEPRGHRESGQPIEPGRDADNPAAIGPAATVRCTIDDWGKYVALHLQAARENAHLLTAETFTKLHTPARLTGSRTEYAMGWGTPKRGWARGDGPKATGRVLTHNGSNTLWFCVTWIAPEKDFAVLIACNQGGKEAETACDEAAQALIKEVGEMKATPAP